MKIKWVIKEAIKKGMKYLLKPAQIPRHELRQLESELKHTLKVLQDKSVTSNTSSTWEKNIGVMRNSFISSATISDFLRWPIIRTTMFHSCKPIEYQSIISSSCYSEYAPALIESVVGNPLLYSWRSRSSGNLIHTAYHIKCFTETFHIPFKEISSIVEFGGGYGCMCRFIYEIGFSGSYTIYDLAEFGALQKYYLTATGHLKDHSISFTSDVSAPRIPKNPDLLIATWSLSESPLTIRSQFLESIGKPTYILIAFQEKFDDIDNQEYFEKMKETFAEYTWVSTPILHLPGSWYLFGKNNS
jgi:hypothetical protein